MHLQCRSSFDLPLENDGVWVFISKAQRRVHTFIALMSVQQMMKKNAIAKVSFRYGSMDALGSSFAHLLGCCNITAEVAKSRGQQGARNHRAQGNKTEADREYIENEQASDCWT